jgi:hypothetical protein
MPGVTLQEVRLGKNGAIPRIDPGCRPTTLYRNFSNDRRRRRDLREDVLR